MFKEYLSPDNISSAVFVLYLIIGADCLPKLLLCRLQKLLENNMLVTHVIGFMTLHFFVTIVQDSQQADLHPLIMLGTSFIYYLIFILSSRTHYYFLLTAIALMFCMFVMGSTKTYYQKKLDEHKIANKELPQYKFLEYYDIIIYTIGIMIVILLVAGNIYYFIEKRYEYQNNWSWKKFILGNVHCSGGKKISFKLLKKRKTG